MRNPLTKKPILLLLSLAAIFSAMFLSSAFFGEKQNSLSKNSGQAPSASHEESRNLLLENPGFEKGNDPGWRFEKNPDMAAITRDAAMTGLFGLRINDDSKSKGCSVLSEKAPVTPGTGYRLTFWARVLSEGGLSVYLRFFDANGKTPILEDGIPIPAGRPEWKQFEIALPAPKEAVSAEVRIYAYEKSIVRADLDAFSLNPFKVEIKPPWTPSYKLSPDDPTRLTEADVVGPDGLVYPDWRMAGVPGGIPAIPAVVGSSFFENLENKDITDRLMEAIERAAKHGGGAVELPAGQFYLNRSILLRESGVIVRGAGSDKTRLVFQNHIPYGEVRLFNWSGTGEKTGPGGTIVIEANPKNLVSLRVESQGRPLKERTRGANVKAWGNSYTLRIKGEELLSTPGVGRHELQVSLRYENGDRFTKALWIDVSGNPIQPAASGPEGLFIFGGAGPSGNAIPLLRSGQRGSRKIPLKNGHGLRPGDRVEIEAPVSERWNRMVGNLCIYDHFRTNYYEIVAVEEDGIVLNQPLRIDYPTEDGSFVRKAAFVERSGLEDLTIEQEVVTHDPGTPRAKGVNWYPMEDLWTNGVTSIYAWGCWVRAVKVVNAARNPIYFTRSKFCEIRDAEANGALFKGGGGTGYVGLERSFDCLMDSVVTHGMRHAPDVQWGSAGCVIRNGRFYGSDGQWHAGWTHENLFEGNLIVSNAAEKAANGGYGFGLFASGPQSTLHGPQGPRNVVYNNDIKSPSDGLHMMGGNEGWIIAYNRFRIDHGRAVYGKEKSFDHVIRGNVFVIQKAVEPLVWFESPDCTGIELTGNSFYGPVSGPVSKLAGFLSDVGAFAREEKNRILPFQEDAPRPQPPVESIFEWQRTSFSPSTPGSSSNKPGAALP